MGAAHLSELDYVSLSAMGDAICQVGRLQFLLGFKQSMRKWLRCSAAARGFFSDPRGEYLRVVL